MRPLDQQLQEALGRGDPDEVAQLIAAGADVRYERESGYHALVDAVHNRDVPRDPRLLDLLRLLIASGAELSRVAACRESGLRVLSHIGRFDAVRLLLEAGADRSQLEWTPLLEAVAIGSLEDVARLASDGADLEATDWWSRTPWLVALVAGDRAKAELLRDRGANLDARGRCGTPPLSYAVEAHHPGIVRWLLELGQAVDQPDEFGGTPLRAAVESNDVECAAILIGAGAEKDLETGCGSILRGATSREMVRLFLDAGADPRHLSQEGHRALCGLGPVAEAFSGATEPEFRRAAQRRFGVTNPERIHEPFWDAMIRTGVTGYHASIAFDGSSSCQREPIWCAQRFGQSITPLPDGRIVQVAGEHEDHYDPDFCIYNDVFVHDPDGSIAIYGYPEHVFPPTDFHTATLVDDAIVLIGSLGYPGTRRYGRTPVYRLDLGSFRIDPVATTGEAPGWIYEHRAVRVDASRIRVTRGTIVTPYGEDEAHDPNPAAFVLDLATRTWHREA